MSSRYASLTPFLTGATFLAALSIACSDDEADGGGGTDATGGAAASAGASGAGTSGASGRGGTGGRGQGGGAGSGATGGSAGAGGRGGAGGSGGGAGGSGGGDNSGWLYTSGNKIYVSDGKGGGSVWVGRGVNLDDIFLCGYNYTLWMTNPEDTVTTILAGLMRDWKPTFIRMSLAMDSFDTSVSWLEDPAVYKDPMTAVINAIGTYPNTYVLVAVRSDRSMILHDEEHGNPEATGVPSDSSTTPNAAEFPNGTDDLYRALVQGFGNSKHVLFGITNEPGGNLQSDERLRAAMNHAVDTIRAEEARLGVPEHVIAVQGNSWTSDISHYEANPLEQDNVVYEVHGYPPMPDSYTYSNLPVIIGEHGLEASMSDSFFADIEAKQIPNLAWDFSPYSNCAPDLVEVTQDAEDLVPTAWGEIVQEYLLAHAP